MEGASEAALGSACGRCLTPAVGSKAAAVGCNALDFSQALGSGSRAGLAPFEATAAAALGFSNPGGGGSVFWRTATASLAPC